MPYAHKVKPGNKFKLSAIDPGDHDKMAKEEAEEQTEKLGKKLTDLQELMYAAGTHSLLIVLQGMDTSGKDGAIKRLLTHMNALSCRVVPFKQPTALEIGHDFLWRIHAQTPQLGWTSIFNRSHYEDVVVVRVHNIVPKDVWKPRYERINEFEALLAEANTIIVKFFLHISKEEQADRLMDREADPEKAYKLSVGDWEERELWGNYQDVYEDAIDKCSKVHSPWYVVPANHKWFRDLAILDALVETLKPFEKAWKDSLRERSLQEIKALKEFRAKKPK